MRSILPISRSINQIVNPPVAVIAIQGIRLRGSRIGFCEFKGTQKERDELIKKFVGWGLPTNFKESAR
jgi:hypothetical protein